MRQFEFFMGVAIWACMYAYFPIPLFIVITVGSIFYTIAKEEL